MFNWIRSFFGNAPKSSPAPVEFDVIRSEVN